MSDDDEWESAKEAAEAWVDPVEEEVRALEDAIAEAVYTFDELALWPELDGVSLMGADLAIRMWGIVEAIRRNGGKFPEELCM